MRGTTVSIYTSSTSPIPRYLTCPYRLPVLPGIESKQSGSITSSIQPPRVHVYRDVRRARTDYSITSVAHQIACCHNTHPNRPLGYTQTQHHIIAESEYKQARTSSPGHRSSPSPDPHENDQPTRQHTEPTQPWRTSFWTRYETLRRGKLLVSIFTTYHEFASNLRRLGFRRTAASRQPCPLASERLWCMSSP